MKNNQANYNTIAPLHNVAAALTMVEAVQNRAPHMPGLGVFHGHSGYGKTTAMTYVANSTNAYFVRAMSVWSRGELCISVLEELGLDTGGTIPARVKRICRSLAEMNRPLIIDDAHNLSTPGMLGVVLDIYEGSHAAIILTGEEMLPKNLERFERIHGRILHSEPALPAHIDDVTSLREIYCRDVELDESLIAALFEASNGSVRRLCVNLNLIQMHGRNHNLPQMSLADWGDQVFYTGQTIQPRRAGA